VSHPRILVAGIGNIFLGDDAFGVEVVRRLAGRTLREGVRVADFGIRGFDLALTLLDRFDLTILVDAAPRGGEPGTVYTIEPEMPMPDVRSGTVDVDPTLHGLDPVRVLSLAKTMGGPLGRVLVVGCEPKSFGEEQEGHMGLSEPVAAAVDEAIASIESLIADVPAPPGG
jgi:hydrogenase maturation protease